MRNVLNETSFMFECFFFFQAEDGIRDYKVTGVQTCALPILDNARLAPGSRPPHPSEVAVPPVGPCSHSTNDRALNRGYDQVVTRAARLFLAATMLAVLLPAVQARAAEPHVLVATLNGVINPITDNYISTAVDKAVSGQANALIIAMDTPGGLDTSMRHIIKKILGAPLPVVMFVSPSGARAASAGLYITEAADIAVMAPGTNIGRSEERRVGKECRS